LRRSAIVLRRADIHLNESAAIPVSGRAGGAARADDAWRRDTAVRFTRGRVVHHDRIWQPGLTFSETTAQLLRRHRVVEIIPAASILSRKYVQRGSACARRGSVVTGRPEPLAYYYFARTDFGGLAGARARRKAD